MKLKVYGIPYLGRKRRIIATTSWAKAAKAVGVSLHYAREYGSITGNEEEIYVAIASPEDVFEVDSNWRRYSEWKKVSK